MSYIIRDRLWPGVNVVEGNHPPSIQGFQVSDYETSRRGETKDGADLTSSLGILPHEQAWKRNACKLLGGQTSITGSTGPMADGLAWDLPDDDDRITRFEHIPPNRQAVTPDITIGRAGTFDVYHPFGSIYQTKIEEDDTKSDTAEGIALLIKKKISLCYNYGDYDDPYAPVADEINEGNVEDFVDVYIHRLPEGNIGRVVATVVLNENGRAKIEEMIAEKRKVNCEKYGGALHISKLRGDYAWTEILLVETVPDLKDIRVSGANFDPSIGTVGAHVLLHPQEVHPSMDFPIERAALYVPINATTAEKQKAYGVKPIYALVPVWDFTQRKVKFDEEGVIGCGVLFPMVAVGNREGDNSTEITVFIATPKRASLLKDSNAEIAFLRITPLVPIPIQCVIEKGEDEKVTPVNWIIQNTPLMKYAGNNPVLSPVRVEAYLKNGRHFRARPDEIKITSKWSGTTKFDDYADEAKEKFLGAWIPGTSYVEYEVTVDDKTDKTVLMWQGIPTDDADELKITTEALDEATVEQAYEFALEASGGSSDDYKWSADGLPEELNLDPKTGKITGTPSAADTYTVNFEITDGIQTTTKELELTVNEGE